MPLALPRPRPLPHHLCRFHRSLQRFSSSSPKLPISPSPHVPSFPALATFLLPLFCFVFPQTIPNSFQGNCHPHVPTFVLIFPVQGLDPTRTQGPGCKVIMQIRRGRNSEAKAGLPPLCREGEALERDSCHMNRFPLPLSRMQSCFTC